jgi:hypothetical protein
MAEEKAKATEAKPELSDAEHQVAFEGPALLANKVYLSITAAGARLAFAEQYGERVLPQFRTAVVLAYQDALALRDLISKLLADIERDLKEAIEEETKRRAATAGKVDG